MIKKIVLYFIAYIIIVLVGILNFFLGTEISFSIFYISSIYLVIWNSNKIINGYIVSFFCVIVWLTVDLTSGCKYSHFFIPYWNAIIRLAFFIMFLYLLYYFKKYYKRILQLVRIDFLTGIYNIRAFYKLADSERNRALRNKYNLIVCFIDLDNFKSINDNFGHKVGNELLKKIANLIKKNLRITDIVARLGGDEFIVLLPQTEYDQSIKIMNKLNNIIKDKIKINKLFITMSIGIANFIKIPSSVDIMIQKADNLMYLAKNKGKNNIKSAVYK
jgi:diguanylate cyclase (GGDEF)-like protein